MTEDRESLWFIHSFCLFPALGACFVMSIWCGLSAWHPSPAYGDSLPSPSACPPLAPATGNIVEVATVAELENAVNYAAPGDTIVIADGYYNLDGVYLLIDTPGVTLRSSSGNREAVILDGNYLTTEIIQIVASGVTIADLTLREAYYHPIHVISADGADTTNTLIYNVHIIDPGEQGIKINPAATGYYTDDLVSSVISPLQVIGPLRIMTVLECFAHLMAHYTSRTATKRVLPISHVIMA